MLCASLLRVTPRRRWPASRPRALPALSAWRSRTGGALAERAREEGVPVIGVPSGMQPRAAVVYMTVGALECAAAAGAAPSLRDEIEGSEEVLSSLADDPEPAGVAGALLEHDSRSSTAPASPLPPRGAGRPSSTRTPRSPPSPASCRRPTTTRSRAGSTAASWARCRRCSSRTRTRTSGSSGAPSCTRTRSERLGAPVARVTARGDTPVARVLSLVMLGDLVSVRLAELRGRGRHAGRGDRGLQAPL